MKKIILRLCLAGLILLILAILGISLFLDGAVKRGIEIVGPRLTKTPMQLSNVSLSILSGAGSIKGLVVGNPEGFKTPEAIRVGNASLSLQPGSLLTRKVVIKSIKVEAPEITFEYGFGGNNLSKILANVRSETAGGTNASAASSGAPPAETSAGKKLEVDDFLITGAKVHVSLTQLGGKTVPVTLPEIHLTNLGQGPDGITAGELVERVLAEVEKAAVKAANSGVADISKGASALTQDLGKSGTGTVGTLKKSLGDLFKKK
jgi:hypothetical protein